MIWSGSALAQGTAAARAVDIFDKRCLEPMPDLDAVADAAAVEQWKAVTGRDLELYRPEAQTKRLHAWTLSVAGKTYQLSVSLADPDAGLKKAFPAFANGQSYGCSLGLPADRTNPSEVTAALAQLLERPHDENYDDGPWNVSTWSAVTGDRIVFVYHYALKAGKPGGLLSLIMIEKN